MNKVERILYTNTLESGDFDFQGFKIQCYFRGNRIVNLSVGKVYPYYDIASLTKIVFTTQYFIDAVENKKVDLQNKVQKYLPWYSYSRVTIGDLLNHSAGNEWWQPFFKKIDLKLKPEQRFLQMKKMCRHVPRTNSGKSVYSDIDFYLLGSVMEVLEKKPLIAIWDDLKEKYYSKAEFHFNYANKRLFSKTQYAPTETCSWRKEVLRGVVHDENAFALGGVAPHAGLFGTIDDLSAYGLMLRSIWNKNNNDVQLKSLKKFSQRSMKTSQGDWGYGFMKPSKPTSSSGLYFSESGFGHTGFTGTSFWYDPKKDLFVSLLSNRVCPTRKNKGFQRLRPKLHNWIVESIKDKK